MEALFRAASVSDPVAAASVVGRKFATLSEALSAEPLLVADYVGTSAAGALQAAHDLMTCALEEKLIERKAIRTSKEVECFLEHLIGFRCVELLVVLLLDCNRGLIGHEILAEGQIDSVDFDPRRILFRALGQGASGLIIAHNHPSGDPTPSWTDLQVTRRINQLAEGLGVTLHDHLVVARGRVSSAMFDAKMRP